MCKYVYNLRLIRYLNYLIYIFKKIRELLNSRLKLRRGLEFPS